MLTSFIHGRWEYVQTEQPVCIQVVQLAPADSCIKTVKPSKSTRHVRLIVPIRKGIVGLVYRERDGLPLLQERGGNTLS